MDKYEKFGWPDLHNRLVENAIFHEKKNEL